MFEYVRISRNGQIETQKLIYLRVFAIATSEYNEFFGDTDIRDGD